MDRQDYTKQQLVDPLLNRTMNMADASKTYPNAMDTCVDIQDVQDHGDSMKCDEKSSRCPQDTCSSISTHAVADRSECEFIESINNYILSLLANSRSSNIGQMLGSDAQESTASGHLTPKADHYPSPNKLPVTNGHNLTSHCIPKQQTARKTCDFSNPHRNNINFCEKRPLTQQTRAVASGHEANAQPSAITNVNPISAPTEHIANEGQQHEHGIVDMGKCFIVKTNDYCPYCNEVFDNWATSQIHMPCYFFRVQAKAVNSGQEPFKGQKWTFECEMCSKPFENFLSLKQHIIFHGPKTYGCKRCSKLFHISDSVNSHVKICHKTGTVEAIKVLAAQKEVKLTKEQTRKNMRTACKVCSKEFSSRTNATYHSEVHIADGDKRFKCQWIGCDRMFGIELNQRHHTRRAHIHKLTA